jgi:hypothetical protein
MTAEAGVVEEMTAADSVSPVSPAAIALEIELRICHLQKTPRPNQALLIKPLRVLRGPLTHDQIRASGTVRLGQSPCWRRARFLEMATTTEGEDHSP